MKTSSLDIKSFIEKIKKSKDYKTVVHHEVMPRASSVFAEPKNELTDKTKNSLLRFGIERLYSHQAKALDILRGGRNLVTMTPTASGKTLIYNAPVLEAFQDDPRAKALYIFPLKGLEQDQLKILKELSKGIGTKSCQFSAEIYDGDTSSYRRTKIRENPPAVVLTNPDMLHLGILAFHSKWESFFSNLKFVVIDELHAYRGVLGSHVAHVLRRLRRVAAKYGSFPQFIASSATIENPSELAQMLTGTDFSLIDESGAPQGKKHFLFIDPTGDLRPYTVATKLFTELVRNGLKTIAFTKSRKTTELMHAWVKESAPDISDKISSYRAGYLPEERRDIEERLFSGELSGVITTSALELGVDIGGLDACVLVGYPGTVSSTWQRAGRVGRAENESLVAMIGLEDSLDKYFMRHPEEFFHKNAEAACLDSENPQILSSHLMCAISEAPLSSRDVSYKGTPVDDAAKELLTQNKIWWSNVRSTWNPKKRYPHREVSIRGTGSPFRIITEFGKHIAEAGSPRILRELHPGAIYMHRANQYLVTSLHLAHREATVRSASVNYYTSPITDESTEIISEDNAIKVNSMTMSIGRMRITENVLGFRRKDLYTRKVLDEQLLELPPHIFTTVGVWFKVDSSLVDAIEKKGYNVPGSLHALEHAMIAALPLYALCDRKDLGGVSYSPFYPGFDSPAIFIYDGHEGGVGLTKKGFTVLRDWLHSTLLLTSDCPCEISCPSCTQDPHCGNNNEPLDKRGAILMLRNWLKIK